MTLTERQYQYSIITVDLSVDRSSGVAAGLTKKINTLTVITLDGGSLSVKLNTSSDKSITLADNMKIEGIPISDLYWINTAQAAGTDAEIFTAWID